MSDIELEEYRVLKGYKHGWVWHIKKMHKEEENITALEKGDVVFASQTKDTYTELMDFFNGKRLEAN